jgi:4-hydroxybenzoate polyprenyltransferase
MLAGGVLVAWLASLTTGDWRPGVVGTLLAVCVMLYDGLLKQTAIGPLLMGGCRALNVLLGMSLAPLATEAASPLVEWGSDAAWLICGGVGVYVAGVTIFSRSDAGTSSRGLLFAGLVVLFGGMALLAIVPVATGNRPPLAIVQSGWFLLWALLAAITARRCVAAVVDPSPPRVQAAVRHCVQTIVVLDAAVCVGYVSPYLGFAVLALIFPTVVLGWWLRAT